MNIILQNQLLDKLRTERTPASVFTINGFQMHGVIADFDSTVIVLDDGGKQQIIYKTAVSTIVPERAVRLYHDEERRQHHAGVT